MSRYVGIGLLSTALLASFWAMGLTQPARSVAAPASKTEEPFHDQLRKAAAEYLSYGRVDDEMRWAPYDCRMPPPATPRFSASKDASTHGRKLYSLFARNRESYFHLGNDKPVPVGQVLVKQSWVPEEVPAKVGIGREDVVITPLPEKSRRKDFPHERDHFSPYAVGKDGKRYKAAKLSGLFIMLKLDPKTKGTDQGWVYGTVTPGGKTVTASGRVESCMKCHQEAKHDRLFGLGER